MTHGKSQVILVVVVRLDGGAGSCVAGCQGPDGMLHAVQLSIDCKPESERERIEAAGGVVLADEGAWAVFLLHNFTVAWQQVACVVCTAVATGLKA